MTTQLTREVYALFGSLPRMDYKTPLRELPENGLYVFYEAGESANLCGQLTDRIVRIGTHKKDGRLRARIRQHYTGNHIASVFRRHLGGALLRRDDPSPANQQLAHWLAGSRPSSRDVERKVSERLRDNFSYSAFSVPLAADRLALESGLIALMAQYPLGVPSTSWLGRHSVSEVIRVSGLWNKQHIGAQPLTHEQFAQLEELVRSTLTEL